MTKNAMRNAMIGSATWENFERRTRRLQSSHAAFAISPREVDRRNTSDLAENHASFDCLVPRVGTFFAMCVIKRLCNLLIVSSDSI